MPGLVIKALGNFFVGWSNRDQQVRLPSRAQSLLAFLVLHSDRMFPRDLLAGMFWGDSTEDKARACLRSTLWRLRLVLEPNGLKRGTYLRSTRQGDISFNGDSDHKLDVIAFCKGIAPFCGRSDEILNDEDFAHLNDALDRYVGDLLDGLYDDWIISERERFRNDFVCALTCKMHNLAARARYGAALADARRILAMEPLRELIYRAVMRLYVQSGSRAEALRHYERCATLLDQELGVWPMLETRALYEEIRATSTPLDDQPNAVLTQRSAPVSDLEKAIRDLQRGLQKVLAANTRVRRSIETLQKARD